MVLSLCQCTLLAGIMKNKSTAPKCLGSKTPIPYMASSLFRHLISSKSRFKSEDTGVFFHCQNKYSKSLSWAEIFKKLLTDLGRKFKFSVQDRVFDYFSSIFWHKATFTLMHNLTKKSWTVSSQDGSKAKVINTDECSTVHYICWYYVIKFDLKSRSILFLT